MDKRKEHFTLGEISIDFPASISLRDIEFLRMLLIAYRHANTVLESGPEEKKAPKSDAYA